MLYNKIDDHFPGKHRHPAGLGLEGGADELLGDSLAQIRFHLLVEGSPEVAKFYCFAHRWSIG